MSRYYDRNARVSSDGFFVPIRSAARAAQAAAELLREADTTCGARGRGLSARGGLPRGPLGGNAGGSAGGNAGGLSERGNRSIR
jgi:hypothetical protein